MVSTDDPVPVPRGRLLSTSGVGRHGALIVASSTRAYLQVARATAQTPEAGAERCRSARARAYPRADYDSAVKASIAVGDRVCTREGRQLGIVVRIQTLAAGITLAYVRLDAVPTSSGQPFDLQDLEPVA